MQSVENLSREELVARVRELQAGADLDFVSRRRLGCWTTAAPGP